MILREDSYDGSVHVYGDSDAEAEIIYTTLGDAIRALHDPDYKDGDDDKLDIFTVRNQPTEISEHALKIENIPVTAKSKLPGQWATLNWTDYIRDNVLHETAPFHSYLDLIVDMIPTPTSLEPDLGILSGYHKLIGAEFDEDNAKKIIKLKKFVVKLPTAMKLIDKFKYHPHTVINLIYRMYECKSITEKCIPMYPMNSIDGKYVVKFTPEYSEQITAEIGDFYETEISYTVRDTTVGDMEYGHVWNDAAIQSSISQAIHRAEFTYAESPAEFAVSDYKNIPIIIGQDIKGRKSYLVNAIDGTTTEYIIPVLIGMKWAKNNSPTLHPWETSGGTYDTDIGGNT